jgi:hypothetical protein
MWLSIGSAIRSARIRSGSAIRKREYAAISSRNDSRRVGPSATPSTAASTAIGTHAMKIAPSARSRIVRPSVPPPSGGGKRMPSNGNAGDGNGDSGASSSSGADGVGRGGGARLGGGVA